MRPRKIKPEGRQSISSATYVKYRVSDDELRTVLNITSPGSILLIQSRWTFGGKEWIITQKTE